MPTPLTPGARRRRRRRRRRLLPLVLVVGCLLLAGGAAAFLATRGGSRARVPPAATHAAAATPAKAQHPLGPLRLVEHTTGSLTEPVQDAVAAAVGANRMMLLGGLTAADTSRTDIRIATSRGDRAAGQLPTALHDTAAVRLGRSVYLFGGGTGANTQSDTILRGQ